MEVLHESCDQDDQGMIFFQMTSHCKAKLENYGGAGLTQILLAFSIIFPEHFGIFLMCGQTYKYQGFEQSFWSFRNDVPAQHRHGQRSH